MQEENRHRPRKLTPSVRRFIFQEAIRQRNIPRDLLANQLIKQIEEIREVPPGFETAKKYISKARNSYNPIDNPWTLGACRDHPTFFPPSSLLFLTKMQQESKKYVDIFTNIKSEGFSIRTSIWIVRLQPLIEEYFNPTDFHHEYEILCNVAESYSVAEKTSEIMDKPAFDSGDLDDSVCTQNLENIFLFGPIGFKNTSSICEGDCESCKYVPIIKGKLCQLKVIYEEQERDKNKMTEEAFIEPNEEGD
jgi:hypothetical protein